MRTSVRAGAWAFVAYCAYLSVNAAAGKETTFRAVVDSVIRFGADKWVAWCVSAICGAGYLHERRLRRKTIKEHGSYIKKLEQKIDPKRSSSRLTETGSPSQEDDDGN